MIHCEETILIRIVERLFARSIEPITRSTRRSDVVRGFFMQKTPTKTYLFEEKNKIKKISSFKWVVFLCR